MHRISSFTAKYLWWQWCWENTDSLQNWSMRIISYGIPFKGRYDENQSKEGSREMEKGTERNFILMLNSNISKGKCHPSKDGECTNYSYLERQWDLYEEVTTPRAHEGSEPTSQSLPPTAEDITVELRTEDSPPHRCVPMLPPGVSSPPPFLAALSLLIPTAEHPTILSGTHLWVHVGQVDTDRLARLTSLQDFEQYVHLELFPCSLLWK